MRPLMVGGVVAAGLMALVLVAQTPRAGKDRRLQLVGESVGGETLVATGQEVVSPPETLSYGSRPVDMVLSQDGRFAYLKDTSGITVIDVDSLKIASQTSVKTGASMCGLALSPDGNLLAYSDADRNVYLYRVGAGTVQLDSTISLPAASVGGSPYPCGIAFSHDGRKLYIALSRANSIQVVDLESHKLAAKFPVDTAPFALATLGNDHLLITSWAKSAKGTTLSADSSGTPVEVDVRGIGVGGTLCDLDLATGSISHRVDLGLQPTEIAVTGGRAYVSVSNADQVFDVDLNSWEAKPQTPLAQMLAGSAPNSVAVTPNWVYVACSGRNTVLRKSRQTGRIEETRTPWYPIAVRATGDRLIVACNEGLGMRTKSSDHAGWNSYDFQGSVSVLGPKTHWTALQKDPRELAASKGSASAVPVPEKTGARSSIEHVIYILKENRTYDQVLGDIGKGDSDPSLTIFGKSVTPNQHALANEFVLLDNYYCNGVLSADGHAWAMEGNATSYFQRSFGGWTRSYPYGDDPLSVSRSGFIWDNALDHGKTVRNFGEFDYAAPTHPASFKQILEDFQSGSNTVEFKQNIGVHRLQVVSQPGYPGWNLGIPDVVRARLFIKDLARMEREKSMPNLVIVYLPQDHTSGTNPGSPSPRSQVADNDLAVGRVVEAVSKSSFWPHTAIFVNEDDPQAGFDHVDGHRSFCLVVSPYARRHTVVSEFYNQTSVLRTIEHMLGLPPMNRFDASSPLMTGCFQSLPDLSPFTALPNETPLDEMNQPRRGQVAIRLDRPDMANEKVLNRLLWVAQKGAKTPYPAALEGSHGRGLAARHLKTAASIDTD